MSNGELIEAYEKHLRGSNGPMDSLGTPNVHLLLLGRVADKIVASPDCQRICYHLILRGTMRREIAQNLIFRKTGTIPSTVVRRLNFN